MKGSLTEHQAANKANCVSALEFLKIANKTLQTTGNSAAFLFGLNKKTDGNSSFSFPHIFSPRVVLTNVLYGEASPKGPIP